MGMRFSGWLNRAFDTNTQLTPGWSYQPVFGRRLNVPNGATHDIWPGVATTRPLPLAAKPMFVRSSSASDAFGVSGAQLCVVTFLDQNYDWRVSDLVVMQGTTDVPITYDPNRALATVELGTPAPPGPNSVTANVLRVQDVFVVSSLGATEAVPRVNNVGAISVVDGSGTVFDLIPIGAGRSRSAAFTCPRGFRGRLTYIPFGTARGQGTAFIGTTFGEGTAWQLLPLAAVDSATSLFENDAITTPIQPTADVQARIQTASNNIDVTCIMQFRLEPLR